MPLRDHFNPPLDDLRSWEELHGGWPMMIASALNRKLPPGYYAAPNIRLGTFGGVDIGALEPRAEGQSSAPEPNQKGVATAVYSPPKPAFVLAGLPGQDEFETFVYDVRRGRRLVAAVELVSPSNKDRPDSRGAFVAKCAELIRRRVSVAIVDVVTDKHFNLLGELLELLDREDPSYSPDPSELYATVCRMSGKNGDTRFAVWPYTLVVGETLPTVPLWLSDDFAVPLELEATYEKTCQDLLIP